MWVHEGFTTYSENLFVEYYYGKQAGSEYVIGQRKRISNKRTIIGEYNVNKGGSGDMYSKGANLLHTLRQIVEDDEKWRQILRGLNSTFYHQTITTKQVEDYISQQSGIDLTAFFNQYLRTTMIPTLEYEVKDGQLKYRWTEIVAGFDMPIQVTIDDKEQWLFPNSNWKTMTINSDSLEIDNDFYVYSKEL